MIRITTRMILFVIVILQSGCYALPYETPNQSPILQLEEKYSVYLDATWTTKQADALLKVFESIPGVLNLRFSQWRISDKDLEKGIKIEFKDKLKFVTISRYIFPDEEDREALSPGKELYAAVVQFLTENGTNRASNRINTAKKVWDIRPRLRFINRGHAKQNIKTLFKF